MRATPTTIKADLYLIFSVVAALGWNLSNTVTIALLGSSTLIAVGLNLAEAHVHFSKNVGAEIAKVRDEIVRLLPAVQDAVSGLPGQVAAHVTKALALGEAGVAAAQPKK